MRINSLTLDNIRSYTHKKIDFPEGTILFEGDIGCGKSTILMAIEFILFGLGDQAPGSLLRVNSKKGYAELDFEVSGKHIIVNRILEKKKDRIQQTEATISVDNALRPVGVTELKAIILDLLKFNESPNPKSKSVIYRYAFFTAQEEMKEILWQKVENRLDTLRKTLQIEDYKRAEKNARDIGVEIRYFRKQGEQVQKELNSNQEKIETTQTEIANQKRISQELKVNIEKSQKIVANLKVKEQEIQAKVMQLAKIETQKNSTKEAIQKQSDLLAQTQKEITENQDYIKNQKGLLQSVQTEIEDNLKVKKSTEFTSKEIEKDLKTLRKAEKEISALKGQNSEILRKNIELEEEFPAIRDSSKEKLTEEIQKSQKKMDSLSKKVSDQQNMEVGIRAEINTIKNKLKETKEELDRLIALPNTCPTCSQPISESLKNELLQKQKDIILKSNQSLRDKQKDLESNSSVYTQMQDTIKEANKKLQELTSFQRIITEYENNKSRIQEYDSKLNLLQQNMDLSKKYPQTISDRSLIEFLEDLTKEITTFEKTQEKIAALKANQKQITANFLRSEKIVKSKAAEIENLKSEIANLEKQLKNITEDLSKLPEVKRNLETIGQDIQTKENTLKDYNRQEATLIESLRHNEEDLNTLRQQLVEIQKKMQNVQKAAEYAIWLDDFFILALPEIEARIMAQIQSEFNTLFQEFFSLLITDPTKSARIDEQFTPIIEQDGYEQQIEYLSGGEKTSVALAYRLALNIIIQQMATGLQADFLILDEPTDGFSKEQLTKFRDLLHRLACRQVILVSHEKELEAVADHIYFVEKQNGISNIKANM